ncbi:hypothetical protein ACOBQX_21300 [Actinokineospora sp. G85]|uniref:hypothetical protein n=1 Tax=Actinokineospora sp. G85 TaxID=3406626 RepID=UPI003C715673
MAELAGWIDLARLMLTSHNWADLEQFGLTGLYKAGLSWGWLTWPALSELVMLTRPGWLGCSGWLARPSGLA